MEQPRHVHRRPHASAVSRLSQPTAGNPYAQGVACEKDFLVGPPCGVAATVVSLGRAYCTEHFEDLLLGRPEEEQERFCSEAVRLNG